MALTKEMFKQKMAEGRAKAKAKRQLSATIPITATIPVAEVNPGGNGNGHTLLDDTIANEQVKKQGKPPPIIIPSMMANAFSHNQGTHAVDYIVKPGEAIRDLYMRANFESTIHVRALNRHVAKCVEFDAPDWVKEEALGVVAGDVSVGGESREQLIRAIVGGDPKQLGKGSSLSDKIKKMAYGDKKEKEEER